MKFYYSPQACSLATHIVLRELGLPFTPVRVDLRAKKTEDGGDFYAINPRGAVAALQLDNGEVLTQSSAILQYLADLRPETGLAPANGTWERARLNEWLGIVGSDIHSGCMSQFFNQALGDDVKAIFRTKLEAVLTHIEKTLSKQDYLLASGFSVADAYLFTTLRWTDFLGIPLAPWPGVVRFMERVNARESSRAALAFELKQ